MERGERSWNIIISSSPRCRMASRVWRADKLCWTKRGECRRRGCEASPVQGSGARGGIRLRCRSTSPLTTLRRRWLRELDAGRTFGLRRELFALDGQCRTKSGRC